MDQERERIQADLRGLLDGEVHCDDLFLQLYSSDASIYEVRPLGVVRPRHLADVVACVQYAAENEIPVHARGAGSGLAGESLGRGLVVDFSYSMRRVISIEGDQARVQPGLVLGQLNRQLATQGRLFGPDPATSCVSTIGGVLSLDGSGSHWLRYGSARSHVERLQVVLADGQVVDVGRDPVEPTLPDPSPRRSELIRRLAELIRRHQDVIQANQPKSLVNRSGYHVSDVLNDGQLDLARLLVGSEGTLGLITEATLRTEPIPAHVGVALLFFDRLELAAQGALAVTRMGVSACDLMDRRLLTMARESDAAFGQVVPRDAEAMLLVEFAADEPQHLRDQLQQVVQRLHRRKRLAFHALTATEPDDVALYWQLTRHVVPSLYRLKGSTRPLPFIEDVAIPPERLPEFVVTLQNVLKNHQVTASLFAHAGHGQLHVRPFLDLADREDVRRMQLLASDLYEKVLEVQGTISGEHGDGLSRTWFVQRQAGPLYELFREVKRIFDPAHVLNPGKVVAAAPQPLTKNLRPVSVAAGLPQLEEAGKPRSPVVEDRPATRLLLSWNDEDIAYTARACNGCARCRTQDADQRMCPMFRFAPREEASPRAKANVMRAVVTGRLDPSVLTEDTTKLLADLCFNCHQCRLECPADVDVPKLMTECKAQYVAAHGMRLSDRYLTRVELLAGWGGWASSLVNWAIGNRQARWLLERMTGVAQGRKLPRLAQRHFLRSIARRHWTRPTRRRGRKVLYFVDVYANWFDVQLAQAVIAVLEHNGVSVYVPTRQVQSGMPAISMGAVETAKWLAARNVRLLADAVRQGYDVVASEPSAALALVREYPHLLDDDDARLVSQRTQEVCDYLWRMHLQGQLELDLKPVNAALGYHEPCHVRALGGDAAGRRLLRLIPGLTVQQIDRGCSGMAGTFGLTRNNYRSSLRAGWGVISALRDPGIQVGTTECSACKIQMEQGTSKPTIHPLKVMALAYGLMPEIGSLLTARGEDLVVT